MAYLVHSSGLLIFRAVAEPRNSGKSREINKNTHKIPWNSVEILSNTCLYSNFETCLSYWGTSHDVKGFAIGSFLERIVVESAKLMMTSVRKTLKTLLWSVQNRSILSEFCPKNSQKIRHFLTNCFLAKFPPKIPTKFQQNWLIFFAILSLKIPQNLTFFPRPIRSPES